MESDQLFHPVLIQFECFPFRSASRLDVPFDAPEPYQALCRRFVKALQQNGVEHTYYVFNASIEFHLANQSGNSLKFQFEGTVWTDKDDQEVEKLDISTELIHSDWDDLDRSVMTFFQTVIQRAVRVEFNRYIQDGELARAITRAQNAMLESEHSGGFMGMSI